MKVNAERLHLVLRRQHNVNVVGLIERVIRCATEGHHPQLQGGSTDKDREGGVSTPFAIVTELIGERGDWMG